MRGLLRSLINRLKDRFSISASWRKRDVGNYAPLTHAVEKDGRLYDPLYDMYVDEFEDDTEANEEWLRNMIEGYENERLIDEEGDRRMTKDCGLKAQIREAVEEVMAEEKAKRFDDELYRKHKEYMLSEYAPQHSKHSNFIRDWLAIEEAKLRIKEAEHSPRRAEIPEDKSKRLFCEEQTRHLRDLISLIKTQNDFLTQEAAKKKPDTATTVEGRVRYVEYDLSDVPDAQLVEELRKRKRDVGGVSYVDTGEFVDIKFTRMNDGESTSFGLAGPAEVIVIRHEEGDDE